MIGISGDIIQYMNHTQKSSMKNKKIKERKKERKIERKKEKRKKNAVHARNLY